MKMERRGSVGQSAFRPNCGQEEAGHEQTKPFQVSKLQVVEAYRRVKVSAGGAGVDNQTLEDFDRNLRDNLYKIWNRLSSGSWMPPPVKAVEIPKKNGGSRLLGVPTVSDRIAQMTVLLTFEPLVERYFSDDSYGYRHGKSALDAIAVTRKRCWQYDWCIEFDIKGLFDNIPHALLLKAVDKHCTEKWVRLNIVRWLNARVRMPDGTLRERNKGTPQGGVISPVLANLFLHYVYDKWLTLNYPEVPWCRYADDGLIHCKSRRQAEELLEKLAQRFTDCGLELHPEKTKLVYCRDSMRKGSYGNRQFDFLGYTFRARRARNQRRGNVFTSFSPAVSSSAQKAMIGKLRILRIRRRVDMSLDEIAKWLNPVISGWLNNYAVYHKSEMKKVCRYINLTLITWARKKYKPLRYSKTKACQLMERLSKEKPELFVHWKAGPGSAFA